MAETKSRGRLIKMDDALWARIEAYAAVNGQGRSAYIREAAVARMDADEQARDAIRAYVTRRRA